MRIVILTIVVSALLGGGGVYLWSYVGGFAQEKNHAVAFINVYGDYAAVARGVEEAVSIPSVGSNSDRAELERLLTTLLTEAITSERRSELARLAYNNLNVIKRQVDMAQTKQAQLYTELEKMDAISKTFQSTNTAKKTRTIVDGARKRTELSARITSIHSEMNEQTHAIISRILQDDGELTREHIQYINETTALAEERFATISGLYTELESKISETERLFKQFVHDAV